jgi:trans-aconitate methyltransferase
LASAGCTVTGVDSSARMLEHLARNDPDRTITCVHGDMVDDLPAGPFDVALVAYNTLFNLLDPARQAACFARVAKVLDADGVMVVEAFVPQPHTGSQVSVRTLATDRVVLSASLHDAATQRAEGQFIEFTEAGGVRLRPWAIRYSTPAELDAMAAEAGLALRDRWAGFDRAAFTDDSPAHVSVYARSVAR